MIAVTGGAGFIGSALVWALNRIGCRDILVVDSFLEAMAWQNLPSLAFSDLMPADEFLSRINNRSLNTSLEGILHMGACSSTTEQNADFMVRNNYRYTRTLAEWAIAHKKRFVYASSAATYGSADTFSDDHALLHSLRPLNLYAWTKHLFDLWAFDTGALQHIAGLKFFNVFGPNEYHKGAMRSVALKAFEEIQKHGSVSLFQSCKEGIPHGGQKRDFVYIKDIVAQTLFLYQNPALNGIFNAGSGKAHTFQQLVEAIFSSLNRPPCINYIPMPESLQNAYQYYTQADMRKLTSTGYPDTTASLEENIADYVLHYLLPGTTRYLSP